jgi:dTDP-4-amino-4,6-dideoxygalactose transaminase
MMSVPFVNITSMEPLVLEQCRAAIDRVIAEGSYILGPAVSMFESAFADYLGTAHCVGVNNGTSALHLAMLACGIGPGDEVITTPITWISTSWGISYVGARPVFVDIDKVTYNIDPGLVEAAITPRTRAILPVHLYGQSANLAALSGLARKHGLALIEDAAQAHGARYNGRRLGTFGDVGCFSFYPTKNLGGFGEGGALVTNRDDLADRARRLRDHAQAGRHIHSELGYNYRMESLQAAVLAAKLSRLDAWNAMRAHQALRYRERLEGTPGLILPGCPQPDSHVWHLYVIMVMGDRDAFRDRLRAVGVETGIHYPTLVPFQGAYAALGYRQGDFPAAETLASQAVSLPLYPGLGDDQIDYVADQVRSAIINSHNYS